MRIATRREEGFTLVEVLAVCVLIGIVVGLAAGPLRNFWLTQGLSGAQDEVASELRRLQQNVVSETTPRVNGAWFGTTDATNGQWGTVQYHPTAGAGGAPTCVNRTGITLRSGVEVSNITFDNTPSGVAAMVSTCKTIITSIPTGARFVFFYARGTATAGTITLHQPTIDRTRGLTVNGVTGRIDES